MIKEFLSSCEFSFSRSGVQLSFSWSTFSWSTLNSLKKFLSSFVPICEVRMKFQNVWFFLCLVFAFHSLNTLVDESYEVTYAKRNETKPVQYLACEELEVLYPNQTKIDLEQLRDDLYDHLNRSIDRLKGRIDPEKFEELVLNQIKSSRYLVLNRRVCLIINDPMEFWEVAWILENKFVYFAINSDTLDLVKMHGTHDSIGQLTVLKKGHPYSDCSEGNARFRCLNECFKSRFRLARYLYESSETGLIQLNYSERNRSIEESERNCFRKCKRENCKLVKLISVDEIRSKIKLETFEARLKFDTFDYWVQFVGLLCSFTGLSFNEFASVAIEFIQTKVRSRKLRIALFCLKLATLLLILASFGYLCTWMIFEHKAEESNPLEKEGPRHLIQPKTVRLAICVYIGEYVRSHERTMWEIEKATDKTLNDVLEGIYLDYGGRSFQTNYQVYHPKKLFKVFLRRCFLLTIQPNYQMTPFSPKLTVKFKNLKSNVFSNPELYLLTEGENLNGNSFFYSGFYAFQKRIVKRLRSRRNCLDYEEKYVNCTGRHNCVERCIQRTFMESYNRTTFGTYPFYLVVLDRDWFSSNEWNTVYLARSTEENLTLYENIRATCLQEIADVKPCEETKFEEMAGGEPRNSATKEIDLPFSVVRSVEEEPSRYKLSLNITNIQNVHFGLTALVILQMILQVIASLIQITFRVRANKIVLFLLYLICSFGASWHTYHILHLVINGELVPTSYYELAKQVQMPVMVFCHEIDQELIDANHQLTGKYLEELTGNITIESMFANVTYLNESNEWTPFDLGRIERFFLLNMKCFRIEIDQQYEEDQFRFSNDSQVLRVNFIKTNEGEKIVRFMTKSNEFAEFSKTVYVDRSYSWVHSIIHETTVYKYEDRFSVIRRHFHSFQDDEVDNFQRKLLELQSEEHKLRTLNLPLEAEAFDMEVEENLFEQLYYSSVEKHKKKQTNYQQLFVDNHLRITWDRSSKWHFTFNLVFLQKVVSSTNEENLGQLILNLLNVLFIWFDLGVLDLYPILPLSHDYLLIYLYLCLPAFICKRLKKLESSLSKLLIPNCTPRQPNARRDRRF